MKAEETTPKIVVCTMINGHQKFISAFSTRAWDNGFIPHYTEDTNEAKDFLTVAYAAQCVDRLVPKGMRQFEVFAMDTCGMHKILMEHNGIQLIDTTMQSFFTE